MMATGCGRRLSFYYRLLQRTVIQYQDPVTGLVPLQKYEHHTWVRDNVYCALGIWSLSLAYRKNTELDEDRARTYELERCCVKLMRGLLVAMMQQADKVERFVETRSPQDCLHAKYNSTSGLSCVGDEDWGHLQLDATSLFLLALAQITASGLNIVYNLDEVAFVQNLVFYVEDAFCTPDYGMWEPGDKTNRGIRELNSSSVGLAKAALEALNELDLFGGLGGQPSVVHVLPDEAQECDAVLTSMLPRESSSKEVDAALLSTISFPAFAVTDIELIELTRNTIVEKLNGQYGMKRFLRDGYKTAREDRNRLYYEPWELQGFENIECEWPLFYCYMMIDASYRGDRNAMDEYSNMLERICIRTDEGLRLVPEMYAVQADKVIKEAQTPHSQHRLPIGEIPFLWAQSLYVLAHLLHDEFISPGELDPLNRRLGLIKSPDVVVQVVLLVENSQLWETYRNICPDIQMLSDVNLVEIHPARVLGKLYTYLGRNRKLGLSGRQSRDVGLLATSKLYSLQDQLFLFAPQNLDSEEFHLVNDVDLFVATLRSNIAVLRSHWQLLGRPIMVVILRQRQLVRNEPPPMLRQTIKKLHSGYINGTRVVLGKLGDFLSTSCIASLDFLGNAEDGEPEVLPAPVQHYLDNDVRQPAAMRTDYVRSYIFLRGSPGSGSPRRRSVFAGSIWRSRSLGGTEHPKPESEHAGVATPAAADEDNVPTLMSRCGSIEESLLPLPPYKSASELHLDQVAEQELLITLSQTDSLEEQGDILHYLAMRKGLSWDTGLGKPHSDITVRDLFHEFYEHAVNERKWALVRHFASALGKRFADLAKSVTDLLVRQKQVTVGMPPHSEEVITRPLTTKELRKIIARAHEGDQSTAMLTQELLAYLAMFIRASPHLFRGMQRLRVGLIIQVMVGEIARTSHLPVDDAADTLLGLSPFHMQSLLLDILSGKELEEDEGTHAASFSSPGMVSPKRSMADAFVHSDMPGSFSNCSQGLWIHRRRLDGALNRVPVGFYTHVWCILERCPSVWVRGYCLSQALTKEMTNGELKFALRVEEMLNMVPEPEYRQLLVETLMVLSLAVENDTVTKFNMLIDIESIVQRADGLFLEDQRACQGNATLCCTTDTRVGMPCQSSGGNCEHFYDLAPSGMYGTMTYLMRSVAYTLPDVSISLDCTPS
ncbi:putative phosphorylase b kinase regulatory subunit alpha [Rhipicephalus microplus]|uniref:putative phosphorylase b kinase regulatory subunit alpha n=1 Tax=Rhipicephalus microplus TaxID=6941 RepID=UPI003F6A6416